MNNFNAIECVTHKRTKIKSRLPQTQNQNHSCISIETKFIVCNMSEFSFENLMSDSCVFSQPNATIFLRKKSQQKRNKLSNTHQNHAEKKIELQMEMEIPFGIDGIFGFYSRSNGHKRRIQEHKCCIKLVQLRANTELWMMEKQAVNYQNYGGIKRLNLHRANICFFKKKQRQLKIQRQTIAFCGISFITWIACKNVHKCEVLYSIFCWLYFERLW